MLERRLLPLAAELGVIARVPLEYGVLKGKLTPTTRFGKDDHRHDNLEFRLPAEARRVEALRFMEIGSQGSMMIAALRFCLSFPSITAVIPGASNPKQVRANALASALGRLSAHDVARARRLYDDDFLLSPEDAGCPQQ